MMELKPITRAEQIMSGKSLEPITRKEMFLSHISNGGGSGGGSGSGGALLLVVTVDDNNVFRSNYDFATVSAAIENDTGVFGVFSYNKRCGPIGEIRFSDGAIMLKNLTNGPTSLTWTEDGGLVAPE